MFWAAACRGGGRKSAAPANDDERKKQESFGARFESGMIRADEVECDQ